MEAFQTILEEQLCIDYGISKEALLSPHNIFVPHISLPGARPYHRQSGLRFLCYNGKVVFVSEEALLSPLQEVFEKKTASWFSEFPNLLKLHQLLEKHGHRLADLHHFYLPIQKDIPSSIPSQIQWYNQSEILAFQDDPRYGEAFAFQEAYPDMLAAAVLIDGEIAAMAGASRDSEKMWQIGVNTMPSFRQKGLATTVVSALKKRLLSEGILPFYGTVESHIASQRVAIGSGFLPKWAEGYSREQSGN